MSGGRLAAHLLRQPARCAAHDLRQLGAVLHAELLVLGEGVKVRRLLVETLHQVGAPPQLLPCVEGLGRGFRAVACLAQICTDLGNVYCVFGDETEGVEYVMALASRRARRQKRRRARRRCDLPRMRLTC